MKNKMIKLPIFLAVITTVCTLLLGFVYQMTINTIKMEASKKVNGIYIQLFSEVTGHDSEKILVEDYAVKKADLKNYEGIDVADEPNDEGLYVVAKIASVDSKVIGYAGVGKSTGYAAGTVKMMFVFDENANLKALSAVELSGQTSGFGGEYSKPAPSNALLAFLQTNPDVTSLTTEQSKEIVDATNGAITTKVTMTGNGLVKCYAAVYSLVKEIKG